MGGAVSVSPDPDVTRVLLGVVYPYHVYTSSVTGRRCKHDRPRYQLHSPCTEV